MSYSVGVDSDDEDFTAFNEFPQAGPSKSHVRQPHAYTDPFGDFDTLTSSARAVNGLRGSDGKEDGQYRDLLMGDDYSGGQAANPLGTADERKKMSGPLNGKDSGYDAYNAYE